MPSGTVHVTPYDTIAHSMDLSRYEASHRRTRVCYRRTVPEAMALLARSSERRQFGDDRIVLLWRDASGHTGRQGLLCDVQYCAARDCPCRDAFLLVTPADDALVSVSRTEQNTILRVPTPADAGVQPSVWKVDIDCAALRRDGDEIDDGIREWLYSEIDIEWLERLHDGWLRAHDYVRPAQPDPEAIEDWNDGRMLFHHDVCPGGRTDIYELDGVRYRAYDAICPDPSCLCDEVHVTFVPEYATDRVGPPIGTATLHVPDLTLARVYDASATRTLIEQLVAALRTRHRDGRALAERIAAVKRVGRRLRDGLAADPPATPSSKAKLVGRNALCPCGSGRKYKRCCGR